MNNDHENQEHLNNNKSAHLYWKENNRKLVEAEIQKYEQKLQELRKLQQENENSTTFQQCSAIYHQLIWDISK